MHEEASSGAESAPLGVKDNTLLNHVPARMGRRHAEARWSPWDLLRVAMGETNTVRFARACPSYTKLAWLTNHTQELQGTSRDTAAAAAVVVVAVAVASSAATTQPRSKKDTHKPDSRMELASRSNG